MTKEFYGKIGRVKGDEHHLAIEMWADAEYPKNSDDAVSVEFDCYGSSEKTRRELWVGRSVKVTVELRE